MKKTTIVLDLKSILTGFALSLLVLFMFGYTNATEAPVENHPTGRYQAVASERGFVILDTQTGDYLIDADVAYLGGLIWEKGTFQEAHEAGRNIRQKK